MTTTIPPQEKTEKQPKTNQQDFQKPHPLKPYLQKRPRRNRKSASIRSLVQETHLTPSQLISPIFIIEGKNNKEEIHSLPGVYRLSMDLVIEEAIELYKCGIRALDLFPVISKDKKDPNGKEALNPNGLLPQTVKQLKKVLPEMCVIVDVALDPFTDHGHDGLINEMGTILNDETLEVLSKMCIINAQAGVDIVAPSDMMDGRVAYIREALDLANHSEVSILSYTAKYASGFYGPFRDALHSAPKFGDKKTYQMNPANVREALLEGALDESEGADFLLVKPALPYLDVLAKLKEKTHLPIGAYFVSGEYAMIQAASQNGWIDGPRVLEECLLSIKRAGADFIFTYGAKEIAKRLTS